MSEGSKFDTENSQLLICNCERTMSLNGKALKSALGLSEEPVIHSQLCRAQIDIFERAASTGRPVLTACTQEAPLFREVAQEKGDADLRFVNIRERAGWCDAQDKAHAKIAALIAEAAIDDTPVRLKTLVSEGVCLVYGRGQSAFDAARKLSSRLQVSLLLIDAEDVIPPSSVEVPIHKGRIQSVSGALGRFDLKIDGYASMVPSSKHDIAFTMERDGVTSSCDLILDLSGETPLVPAHDRRDGYVRADPDHPAAVAEALFEVSDLVGEFEKPIYVTYNSDICAHGRSGKVGCSICIDNCPLSAIEPNGDHVKIDEVICGGCGNCSASCPTGAVSYDFPPRADLIHRCQTLLSTYLSAGGERPVLLFHDDSHGSDLISAIARFGRGLPINVLPVSVYSPVMVGHDLMAAAFASGAHHIVLLVSPTHAEEKAALESQVELANAFLSGFGFEGASAKLIGESDPDLVETALYDLPEVKVALPGGKVSFVGSKREIARTALVALNDAGPSTQTVLPLPQGAPYGRIAINTEGCTLCLACVGACPAGALSDNPDRPEVRFTEAACVQCGLCKSTCPEKVIGLEARFNFTPEALSPVVLNGDDPFHCIRCGKAFGTKASVERVLHELQGKHWMFQTAEKADLIKMCDDCRVIASMEDPDSAKDPFAVGEPPRPRTTEDYLEAEEKARKSGRTADDFLN